ncbi:G-protein coupled bile acid receptor 1-like [Megalops cyprinoides]|uniref:G-protein coupled bile acid receptor 1-like n=1 Tax=Megalops cyprinoides TaxID=118141 RepID=UPI0018651D85|nr:G-protein coupled bile acid receptor 1-like [Megalops cyprinoides]
MTYNDSLREQERLIYCITVPLSTVIILANLLIILGIACNRNLHNTPNYFFLSLLVADLCTGVALPFIPWMGLNRKLDFQACLLVHIFPNFLFLSFLFNLVMVHYERYLCIVSPLHYSRFWVHRCFPLALLAVWVPPLLYASLPAFGWNNRAEYGGEECSGNCSGRVAPDEEGCSYKLVFPNAFIYLEVYGLLVPAILSIVLMTGRVLWITRGQLRHICRLHRAVGRVQASDREHRLNLRYAKCVAAVSLSFLACWVPYIIYTHVSLAMLQRSVLQDRLQSEARQTSSTLIVLSCTGIGSMAIIPVILGLGNREYTDPARKLFCKLRARWRRAPETEDIEL